MVVVDGDHKRRFDVVLYVNGMPPVVLEQLRTCVDELPPAFRLTMA